MEADADRPSVFRAMLKVSAIPAIFGISMGGLYLGVATPTESGAVGAFLSLIYCLVTGRLNWTRFWEAASQGSA